MLVSALAPLCWKGHFEDFFPPQMCGVSFRLFRGFYVS